MKKIRIYINKEIYEFRKMPRLLQIILIALLVLFIYVFIDLCFIRAEISKIQKEREVLERYPL
ncbi:hypothetical protein [Flavobacterium sp. GSB-24]|uniref:hypothetical protein n=1 Tax=Flavobacterium sp. GSB-24 TaxID=2994319 RepID=UPI002491E91E|nr:hypothetical protein [Flavobacterium sp. GSB-24]BDU27698.1 hypothetical protein FLGSB24_44420 [Flavobacterium sp. GSB-24]